MSPLFSYTVMALLPTWEELQLKKSSACIFICICICTHTSCYVYINVWNCTAEVIFSATVNYLDLCVVTETGGNFRYVGISPQIPNINWSSIQARWIYCWWVVLTWVIVSNLFWTGMYYLCSFDMLSDSALTLIAQALYVHQLKLEHWQWPSWTEMASLHSGTVSCNIPFRWHVLHMELSLKEIWKLDLV